MTQQRTPAPAALIHAAWLEKSLTIGAPEAASELRRLHEVEKQRDELLAELEKLTEVFANIGITSGLYDDEQDALKSACAAIASLKGEQ